VEEKKDIGISSLEWQRMYLRLTLDPAIPQGAFIAQDVATGQELVLQYLDQDGYYAINVTTAIRRAPLPAGTYRLGFKDGSGFRPLALTVQQAGRLDQLQRVFYYGKGFYSYNVTVEAEFSADRIYMLLRTAFMMANDHPKRRRIAEGRTAKGRLKQLGRMAAEGLIKAVYGVGETFARHDGRHVLFMSQTYDHMSGNLQVLSQRLEQRQLGYKITYSVEDLLKPGAHLAGWWRSTTRLCGQDYIFTDDYEPVFAFVTLSPKTKLIQVWHSGAGFKTCGFGRYGHDDAPHPYRMSHRQIDYAVVCAKPIQTEFMEIFGLEADAMLPVGIPRLDGYMDPAKQAAFRQKFFADHPQWLGKKIILFAPTFRGKGGRDAYYDFSQIDFKGLDKVLGDQYVMLFKFHPFVRQPIAIPDYCREKCFDFTSYPDINQLFYVTDLLITDYSSCFYEFALFHKPMLFFTPDEAQYALERGFYRSVEDTAPGTICRTFPQLLKAIRDKDFDMAKIDAFIARSHNTNPGTASDAIIDTVLLGKPVSR